jgi:hypothetical protein
LVGRRVASVQRRRADQERVAGIEHGIAVVEEDAAVQIICARLGQDFDAPETKLVVLRGEGILIDANFTDGILGRQRTASESFNSM